MSYLGVLCPKQCTASSNKHLLVGKVFSPFMEHTLSIRRERKDSSQISQTIQIKAVSFLHVRMALTTPEAKEKISKEKVKMHLKMYVLLNDFARILGNGVFVWARVVFLGAFADDLSTFDFRLVSFIIVMQFMRQRGSDKVDFDERKRQAALEGFDLLTALDHDLTESISTWQLYRFYLAAFRLLWVSVGNSDFGSKIMTSDNGRPALFLFYLVALMEGLISLSSLGFVISNRIIMKLFLGELYGLESSWGEQVILAIHYDIKASIRRGTQIENLKIEVLPFALDLFTEELPQNSHFGVLILSSLARGNGDLGCIMKRETLDAIISKGLVEKLLVMISSREPNMEHFRLAAAQILLELWSVPQYYEIMTANPRFWPAIETLSEDLADYCPSSSSGERVQERHRILGAKLKEIGSKLLYPPPPTPSASSSDAPPSSPPVDVSGLLPESEQQQHYGDLALQNQQQRDMICTLHIDVSSVSSEQQQSFGP